MSVGLMIAATVVAFFSYVNNIKGGELDQDRFQYAIFLILSAMCAAISIRWMFT